MCPHSGVSLAHNSTLGDSLNDSEAVSLSVKGDGQIQLYLRFLTTFKRSAVSALTETGHLGRPFGEG